MPILPQPYISTDLKQAIERRPRAVARLTALFRLGSEAFKRMKTLGEIYFTFFGGRGN